MPLVKCDFCSKEIKVKQWSIDHYKTHFCDSKCHAEFKKKGKHLPCKVCDKVTYKNPAALRQTKSGFIFCSRKCSTIYSNKNVKVGKDSPNFKNGKGVQYRKFALEYYGHKCMNPNCPITFHIPVKMLDVHHKDEDRSNNKINNLEVLCVWCHALKTRKLDSTG